MSLWCSLCCVVHVYFIASCARVNVRLRLRQSMKLPKCERFAYVKSVTLKSDIRQLSIIDRITRARRERILSSSNYLVILASLFDLIIVIVVTIVDLNVEISIKN